MKVKDHALTPSPGCGAERTDNGCRILGLVLLIAVAQGYCLTLAAASVHQGIQLCAF